ncbi:M23 family metallopeptidase [Streptomyces albidus (ex Kaewkla and Franco 2022)]|uniref:M23 family metallopeptidase n=1 Tax=Streptomyces albidus (ex Kaewkla and Franco 2022) TaxID=722709 RepID=UPI0028153808|nr:M23 family metallopeptidase [Streptomyces albidus (ex Kaewkla and Franco 2022)]
MRRGWEPPPTPWAAGHRGVDLAAPQGRAVRAVADGRVSFSGKVAGRGVLSIELSGTGRPPIRTTYEPVRPTVREGDRVRAGETVAFMTGGLSHCGGGCLHWGARRGTRYLDPLSLLPAGLLRGGPSRLLPVFGIPLPRSDASTDSGSSSGASSQQGMVAHGAPATTRAGPMSSTGAGGGQVGAGGAVLALALAGAALFGRRRLSRTVAARTSRARRPPRAPP